MITRRIVHDQLVAYLNQRMTLDQLVDWAENVMSEGDLDPLAAPMLREIIARLGLADVKAFGLSWDDCHAFLSQLGYKVEVVTA